MTLNDLLVITAHHISDYSSKCILFVCMYTMQMTLKFDLLCSLQVVIGHKI